MQFRTTVLLTLICLILSSAPASGQATGQLWPDDPNAQYIIFASGRLEGGVREYEVPIEAKTFRLNFWARTEGEISLEILSALGKPQSLTDPNVSPTLGRDRQSVVIFDPKPGLWKLRLKGEGSYTVGVTTQSELYVCCLSLINPGGPIGHPLPPTVPLRLRQQAMQASIAGFEVQAVEFNLIDEEHRLLGPVKLRQNDFSNPYVMIMLIEAPSRPFRILARGRDQSGFAFQRIFLPLFQPPAEVAMSAQPNSLLTELIENGAPGPYRVVRVAVEDLSDELLLSDKGSPIGLRLKYSLRFPRDGYYTPIPQVYPERISQGYTGALSMKVHRYEIAPLPESPQSLPQMRFLTRASYKAGQVYRFTVDLIPNYALFNEQTRSFCIASRTFSHSSRERFLNEVTSETRMRFRLSIQGTEIDSRQPHLTEQTYIPKIWYNSFQKEGAGDCQ